MPSGLSVSQAAVLLVGLAACVTDFRSRRIPNVLTFGASAAAFVFWAVSGGPTGLGFSVAGWLVGCLLFLPWFLLRGMGGGDVKLLAALGAWAGPGTALWIALYAAVAGGVFAIVVTLAVGLPRHDGAKCLGFVDVLARRRGAAAPRADAGDGGRPAPAVRVSDHRGCSGSAMAPIRLSGRTGGRTRRGAGRVRAVPAAAAGGHCRHRGLRLRVSAVRGDHQRRTRGRAAGQLAAVSGQRRR